MVYFLSETVTPEFKISFGKGINCFKNNINPSNDAEIHPFEGLKFDFYSTIRGPIFT